ncbi:hypothetical protein LINPERHAP2_LOCUS16493 [Linum perenne]
MVMEFIFATETESFFVEIEPRRFGFQG